MMACLMMFWRSRTQLSAKCSDEEGIFFGKGNVGTFDIGLAAMLREFCVALDTIDWPERIYIIFSCKVVLLSVSVTTIVVSQLYLR
ncbi:unnamed protein product [Thlaspi arvense]|uniref:Uncharacterized protein n=1 Tax=Thlaspi arvense TaxID=13288 RepID=A0AAU9R7H4_THLAR|nr:unnamed protein product [Thlaspi arvense]